jgi:transposase-like protein
MYFMKGSIEDLIERLRGEYGHELIPQPGNKNRTYSKELKRRLLSESKLQDVSTATLAKGLGIGASTVMNWKHQSDVATNQTKTTRESMFRKVNIKPEQSQPLAPYLEGKSGIRVFGLSVGQMAELLRCL